MCLYSAYNRWPTGVCWCSPVRRALVAIQSGKTHWLLQMIVKVRRQTTLKVADSEIGCQPLRLARKKRTPRGSKRLTRNIKIDSCSLCNEELCQLVLKITHGGHKAKPFLRRMVILWDSLKTGETKEVLRLARQNKDPVFAKLIAPVLDSVSAGDLGTASIIVFLAAGFAYQNTLDYYLDLRSYLDRFR